MKNFIAFLIFFTGILTKAKASEGYIITATGDTTWGAINVRTKISRTGKPEIDFKAMETEIIFVTAGKPQRYKPGDIKGYGFNYEGTWYHFGKREDKFLDTINHKENFSSKILYKPL